MPRRLRRNHTPVFKSKVALAAITDLLKKHGIRISMDGKGAWRDNVFIERLWRSVTYEEVYFHAYDTASDSRGYQKIL